jgi:hypothetical protein
LHTSAVLKTGVDNLQLKFFLLLLIVLYPKQEILAGEEVVKIYNTAIRISNTFQHILNNPGLQMKIISLPTVSEVLFPQYKTNLTKEPFKPHTAQNVHPE